MYLKEHNCLGTKNYPSTIIDSVALITSFGANSERNDGCGGGVNDADKSDAIVSLHLAEDNSDNKYSDDNEELVGSVKSDDLNNERTSSDDESIGGASIITSELENNNIDNGDITGGDDDSDNDNNNGAAGDDNSENSSGEVSDSNDVSNTSVAKPNDNDGGDTVAPWFQWLLRHVRMLKTVLIQVL